ncbi:transcription-repair coupling factor [Algoriphagus zhangzhouensis]|uniref:Transcription-repair-coupling factor n=1 Tax=Algoriphagus zhangzhouensis TaxID=1073327 RepID=A0A1M7ZAA8_9BACT|nr:transcription-repair coupling factor [Algoriphagus zhangzhouensis]TDY47183.1 transcription-repair coupling factor (superfamily II helicase) [Algoriphagus zhangzhouensis]SHO61857.1 transcription-repair coupling factor (superfamily II helicase) [Algoriphagus zhangzhouensis]
MDSQAFLTIYKSDPFFQTFSDSIHKKTQSQFQLKGVSGSLDMVLFCTYFQKYGGVHLIIAQDKEEAAYLNSDIQNLLSVEDYLIFPSSFKKAYHYEEVDNANVLLRSEVLNQVLESKGEDKIIITYPEALYEKVINKRSLQENTFIAKVGEKVDMEFVSELLVSYDFERTDFVYEPGQFAIRGGILDVFSFSNENPYRIELFGQEIESIRTFDPESQLSIAEVPHISLIPNTQTKLLQEVRQSFLGFLPESTKLWIKDYQLTADVMTECFHKAEQEFDQILSKTNKTKTVLHPKDLFETGKDFADQAKNFSLIEFGKQFYLKNAEALVWDSQPQPSFNKNFDLLVSSLSENEKKGFTNIITAENEKQLDRLLGIFTELDPTLLVQTMRLGLREGFEDRKTKLVCYTDHQLFERFHRYKTRKKASKSKALTIKELKALHPGDYIVHVDYGVGRFAGLEKVEVGGKMQEAVRLVFRDDDLLYVNIHSLHKISKYSGQEGQAPSMSKLGSPDWENKKRKAKKQVKDIAKDLIALYAKRRGAPGFAFARDSVLQVELESSFIYEDTPDQALATSDVKSDMEKSYPMDRLVCGDVGFGKTEVAIRAAFKAVNDRKQVAILVPTTILAMQHYQTIKERLSAFPVKVDYINRFRTAKQVREIVEQVKTGEIDILVGTHRIVNKDVQFKDLGLLIIDEEQKFGVKVKDQLKNLRVNVDVLTLTATPIPRTLHFSLMGARDLSVIATPPPNRQPVTTEVQTFEEEVIRDAVAYELRRGGQAFFVHNRVGEIDSIANLIMKLVPDARVIGAHGQMDGKKLEQIMVDFINHEYDVLVSTNIIESGLDIPNANTIMINRAHMFGMSDLHQMRGRVGRSNKKAFCYLLTPPMSGLTPESRKRLQTLEEFSDLGDGFKVAMKDLDIRGAGNLLGAEQSGFITDLGFEMYHKILDEAVQELKENEFAALFEVDLKEKVKVLVQDCTIETDLELLIPENYVSNISERLGLYSKLDSIKNEEELEKFGSMLDDRFGPIPEAVVDLMETVRLRWKAEKLGIEKLVLKSGQMKCYMLPASRDDFYSSPIFQKIMLFAQLNSKYFKIKEHKNRLILTVSEVSGISKAQNWLKEMLES